MISPNREVETPKWKYYLYFLFNALKKIPKAVLQQDVYRGVDCNLVKDYPTKYVVGKKIIWYSFTSTTTNLQKIMRFLPPTKPRTIFTINGVFSGRYLQQFSAHPSESEVLLPPASRFEVLSIVKLDPNTHMIQMKQIPGIEKLGLE